MEHCTHGFTPSAASVEQAFALAQERFAAVGVDVEAAMAATLSTPVSMHCWQGDDVIGFERSGGTLSGGIQATGNYPGRARTPDELMDDLRFALSKLPGIHRLNLHANYPVWRGQPVDRDALEREHFAAWVDFANQQGIALDFNTTFFSHPLAEGGTLSHPDAKVRAFWIRHAQCVRRIGESFARGTGQRCYINHWTPDGDKEVPADTLSPRIRLRDSYDEIFSQPVDAALVRDAVESKLFGIGSEAYVPGSHEFYMGYALTRPDILLTLDAGHFHPTEGIALKLSALLCYLPELLLHVSRPMRWDSDHVVLLDDATREILREVVRLNALDRVHLATDYFDASIHRVTAWIVGLRATRRALLYALLEPFQWLRDAESAGDFSARMALGQEILGLPYGAVWDMLCHRAGLSAGSAWVQDVQRYERTAQAAR